MIVLGWKFLLKYMIDAKTKVDMIRRLPFNNEHISCVHSTGNLYRYRFEKTTSKITNIIAWYAYLVMPSIYVRGEKSQLDDNASSVFINAGDRSYQTKILNDVSNVRHLMIIKKAIDLSIEKIIK